MAEIENFIFRLMLDPKGFKTGEAQALNSIKNLKKGFLSLSGISAGVLGTMVSVASLGIKEFASFNAQVNQFSVRVGENRKEIEKWKNAIAELGIEEKAVLNDMEQMDKLLGLHETRPGALMRAFRVGVPTNRAVDARSASELILMMDRYARMQYPLKRDKNGNITDARSYSSALQQLGGLSQATVDFLLNIHRAGKDPAEFIGKQPYTDDNSAKDAEQAAKEAEKLKNELNIVIRNVGMVLMPSLREYTDELRQMWNGGYSLWARFFGFLGTTTKFALNIPTLGWFGEYSADMQKRIDRAKSGAGGGGGARGWLAEGYAKRLYNDPYAHGDLPLPGNTPAEKWKFALHHGDAFSSEMAAELLEGTTMTWALAGRFGRIKGPLGKRAIALRDNLIDDMKVIKGADTRVRMTAPAFEKSLKESVNRAAMRGDMSKVKDLTKIGGEFGENSKKTLDALAGLSEDLGYSLISPYGAPFREFPLYLEKNPIARAYFPPNYMDMLRRAGEAGRLPITRPGMPELSTRGRALLGLTEAGRIARDQLSGVSPWLDPKEINPEYNINVYASGTDPASIAAAARSGVEQANGNLASTISRSMNNKVYRGPAPAR